MATEAATPEGSDRPDAGVAVTITPMRRRHLPSVLRIEGEVYPRPWSEELFLGEITYQSRSYVVARVGPDVVGYAGLLVIADDGHLTTVAVDSRWRRHAVASRMVLELCRQAVGRGCNQLTLEVRASNRGAQELYRHFGFAPAGVRKGYYADDGEDAIIMWAHEVSSHDYAERLDRMAAAMPGSTVREGFEPAAGRTGHPSASDDKMGTS
jgi:ribosomal-protein-alanine N-acetyltransferase